MNNIFEKIVPTYNENNIGLINMTGEFFALYIKRLFLSKKKNVLIVTPTIYEANKIYNNLSNLNNSYLFQSEQILNKDIISSSPETKSERLNVLNKLIDNDNNIVVTDVMGYITKVPKKDNYKELFLTLKAGNSINLKILEQKIYDLGYKLESITTNTGEYSSRGFVLDIFPINEENPIRIEFFGDEIESIRYYDPLTQKSIDTCNSVTIKPFNESISDTKDTIIDYMDDPYVIFKDYEQIKISKNKFLSENFEEADLNKIYKEFDSILVKNINYYFEFDNTNFRELKKVYDFNIKEADILNEDIDKINKYLSINLESNKAIIICLNKLNKAFIKSLTVPYIITDENKIKENIVNIIIYDLTKGFKADNYIFLTEYELFNKRNITKRNNPVYKYSTRIKDITNIETGDYVVHNTNGIGIYNGLKTLTKNGIKSDYLEILYANKDKLYIPASKIYLINKFSGKEGSTPKINALNSTTWIKTKQKIRERIKYEAERLLKVQAERNLKKGHAFSIDNAMQVMFENEFIYEETSDQRKVTDEIKKDMESILPMDRILCGDVGYGKTEVAFRAIFKCAMDSKQAMYLCPTTLLSKQQYKAALDRFSNYPVNISILNRFVSQKKAKQIVNDFSNGKIDILFGTHRILSNDIKPKDLGLLVIDEEQRFGVAHKEKIKEFKSNIDVLTLTATPIPRTLQMAMLGLRNLSLIETPPKNRKAIQTYIAAEDDRLIRDIIYKEMSRNGQVYILYNRVENIENIVSRIKRLTPEARVTYAHGQMNKLSLEERMSEFIEGKYDVLICTTIIETGVDIPNVNSLIIIDADRFGLSQLYQIRGRIGRSDKLAYSYLMYQKNKALTETAIKRLNVLKEFTELGSGFSIAARDLSIRGAGDILGSEQAGFIDTVGIDMYMKMLEEEMKKLKGIPIEEEILEESPAINISNHIDNNYVSDEQLKIEIHKMISKIKTEQDLEEIKQEIEDRFGKIDKELYSYMQEQIFENLIIEKDIESVVDYNNDIELVLSVKKSNDLNYEDLFVESIKINNNFKYSYLNKQIHIKLSKSKTENIILDFIRLLKKM